MAIDLNSLKLCIQPFLAAIPLQQTVYDLSQARVKFKAKIKPLGQPESISGLAELTGRKQSNLSRTLKTMSQYGLVEMVRENRQVKPIVKATEFQILAA